MDAHMGTPPQDKKRASIGWLAASHFSPGNQHRNNIELHFLLLGEILDNNMDPFLILYLLLKKKKNQKTYTKAWF